MSPGQAERAGATARGTSHWRDPSNAISARRSPRWTATPATRCRPTAAEAARAAGPDPIRDGSALTGQRGLELFDAQLASRHLDLAARWLRARGRRVLHDRVIRARGQRRRGRGAADHRPGPAALPLRRVLPGPVPAGHACPGTGSAMSCSGWLARRTSPSPAAATRCSATGSCTSSRRPRPSPRTCPAPSGWPSPWTGRPGSAGPPSGPRTRSWPPASATRR